MENLEDKHLEHTVPVLREWRWPQEMDTELMGV